MYENIDNLKELLKSPRKIVITTHRGPDGDAMGSSLGLYHFLIQLGHTVNVITPNEYANFLHWLPGNDFVINYEVNPNKAEEITNNSDIIFLLDLNNIDRLSSFSNCVSNSNAIKILIDHHQDPDNNIAKYIFSNVAACSTAEIVYEIIHKMDMNEYMNKNIAECLYTGIMTDTGSFKFASTNFNTHKIISELILAGANNSKIHDLVYDSISAERIKLLGYCLNEKLLLYPKNNAAIISLNAQELERFKFKSGDTEGFVNYPLSIKGINFAAFIAEKEGLVKLSLRSKGDIKVNEIAKKYFNGGGHINAAGGISDFSVNETIKLIEKIIINGLK